jgi:putative aminopeptidase FrvX
MNNKKLAEKYIYDILNIPSPTGYTKNIMNYIKKELDILNVKYRETNKGALIITLDGNNSDYQKTLSAHVDTLGAMVKNIKASGKIELTQIGGFMMNSIEGENCNIHTRDNNIIEGTVQTIKPSVHIHGDEARNLPRLTQNYEVIVDEKVDSKEDVESLGVNIGDFISFDTRTKITDSGFIKSRYLDDKSSVGILLYVIRYLSQNKVKLNDTINFFISNYEEVGHGSSASIPENTKEFIAVDMGCPGQGQNSTEYACCICTKDSSGPYDYDLTNKLVNICKDNNIEYKLDIYPFYGSDASAALKAGWDIKTALIGPGIFASHGYERTHMDSIMATTDLIIKYCQE